MKVLRLLCCCVIAALAMALCASGTALAEHPLQHVRIKGVAIGTPLGETGYQVILRNDANLATVIGDLAASPIRDQIIAISFFMNYDGRNAIPKGPLNLAGVERLPALQTVGLGSTNVVGWEHLATRPLKMLVLSGVSNSDLAIVGKLTKLEALELTEVGSPGLAPLNKLTALRRLKLNGEAARDLAALNLPNLEELEITHVRNHLLSYEPVAALKGLKSFRMTFYGPADLTPLTKLPKLEHLDMQEPAVLNYAPIANMPALRRLRLYMDGYRRQLADTSFLSKTTQLEELDLSTAEEGFDISSLSSYAKLRKLTLFVDPKHTTLEPLRSLTNLEELRLGNGPKENATLDASPLAGLTKLKRLDIHRVKADWSFIANLTALNDLDLSYSIVGNIPFAAHLVRLRTLKLEGTDVDDIAPIAGLTQLERLIIDRTRVRSIAVLESLPALNWVQLHGAPIKDFGPLERRPKVRWFKTPPRGDALRALLANQTIHSYVGNYGNQVEYLSDDGGAFKWSGADPTIVKGEWKLKDDDKKVCFRYDPTPSAPKGDWWCQETHTWYNFADIRRKWQGDVYGLSKSDAAPSEISPFGDLLPPP